tara:strand:- start:2723 stop:3289 length:567 start_codon:yes stop_codon:yes gene_type:complete
MRIIAGKLKGSNLYFPTNKNTRPLKDMVRESIFNLLTHSNKLFFQFKNSNILDLYSGTGSFGLECLSREAKTVCFVEKGQDITKILEKNIEKFKLTKKINIFISDVFSAVNKNNFKKNFNLIFCDPPFQDTNIEKLIHLIFIKKILKKEGIIILHRHKNNKDILPNYLEIIEERTYGVSKIYFGKFLS